MSCSIGAGAYAQVLGAVAAEVAQGSEIHEVGNLCQGQAGIVQVFLQDGDGVTVDVGHDTAAGHPLDCGRQVFLAHMELAGIPAHFPMGAGSPFGQEAHQFANDESRPLRNLSFADIL